MNLNETIALVAATLACVFDLQSRRIPNALTLGAAAAALIVSAGMGGLSALGTSASGWTVATLLWLPLYALGGMGGGDVKLMAAIGAWLGPGAAVHAALYAAMAGAVLAVGVAINQRCVRQTYANIQLLVLHWRVVGFTPQAQLTLDTATSPRLAYAVPILIGTVVAIWRG